MALPSYLSRREGRYYLQVRLARPVASIMGRPLYRASLRTTEYRQARLRLAECMGWLHRMNESVDYVTMFQKNAAELQRYLTDQWPIAEERLVARQRYEELLKNLVRRARAAGCDPAMIEPDYHVLFQRFVRQNLDAAHWQQRAEAVKHYERGRSDMHAAMTFGAVPQSFAPATPDRLKNREAANARSRCGRSEHRGDRDGRLVIRGHRDDRRKPARCRCCRYSRIRSQDAAELAPVRSARRV